jgi:hypothetical protein
MDLISTMRSFSKHLCVSNRVGKRYFLVVGRENDSDLNLILILLQGLHEQGNCDLDFLAGFFTPCQFPAFVAFMYG